MASLFTRAHSACALPLVLLLFGCDCWRGLPGVVCDERSRRPLENAQITSNNDLYRLTNSDSEGRFTIIKRMRCTGKRKLSRVCENIPLEVVRDGYSPFDTVYRTCDLDTIWLSPAQ